MKRILLASALLLSISSFAQQGYRYDIVPGTSSEYSLAHNEIKAIPYAATKTLAPTMEHTVYDFATLTGATTLSVTITPCFTGDQMICLFKANTTARVVTFSTGFTSKGTLTVLASSSATIRFVFNGTAWIETERQNFNNFVNQQRTSTAFTGNASVTAAQLAGGLLTITSGTDTLTLPTATAMGAAIGAVAGTTFDFVVSNIASGGTALMVVNTGIVTGSTLTGGTTLTCANSATLGVYVYRMTFLSATAAKLSREN